ncbi:MAG: Holliday junction branch migration protein RuvA [Desulfovibrio sp.]|nr:Holliday junction branch migration protein RuvA [Desulfovibrio sp.]
MISYLEGRLLDVSDNACVLVTTGGVGYSVGISAETRKALPEKGASYALYTSLIVREDALELFGFASREERETFELLISISKIGARTALAVLSVFRPEDLNKIVADGDALLLTQVPGIGKKTAQYVFLELKDKLKMLDTVSSIGTEGARNAELLRSVLDGLTGLGYNESETYPVVREILQKEPDLDVSAALRAALQALSKGAK